MRPSAFRRQLQVGTFFRKELLDVVRQPRLLFTLVLGPFFIMAIFAIGYRDTAKPMRTLFVGPKDSPLLGDVEQYADELGNYVRFEGISNDEAEAERKLMKGDIDLIVSFPADPLHDVLNGKSATISVIHTRLDPVERTAISFATRLAVDQINGEVLAEIVGSGQGMVRPAAEVFAAADASVTALDSAISAGDRAGAQAAIGDLQDATAELSLSVQVATLMTQRLGDSAASVVDASNVDLPSATTDLGSAVDSLSADSTAADVDRVRSLLDTLNTDFDRFATVDPQVLVHPLQSEVRLAVDNVDSVTDWYAPAAVVLVLQQFGIAFGALSFVRERQLGIVEVLRIAPVGAAVTLIGKYLAYLLIGGAIGALLTGLVVGALDVPLAAGLGDVAVVMALTLFASIGVGFLISLASANDAQAVQYTMIVLLASLFFSGFFLSVGQMQNVAVFVSWLLPVSYGMALLRDVMLRGASPYGPLLLGLAAYGVVVFVLALLGTRRRIAGAR